MMHECRGDVGRCRNQCEGQGEKRGDWEVNRFNVCIYICTCICIYIYVEKA
jgi:hypothetical protein